MTSIEQSIVATTPDAATVDQPIASTVSAPMAPVVPVAPAAKAKIPTKRVLKAPAKKVTAPVTAATAVAVKPMVKSVARKTPPVATKPVAKTLAKTVVKAAPTVAPQAAAKTPVKAEPKAVITPAPKPKVEKLLKAKKPKLVRDSFTIPKLEYLILEELKQRSSKLGNPIKKSELIRAGIKALAAMADASLLASLRAVPAIKTGRPAKD